MNRIPKPVGETMKTLSQAQAANINAIEPNTGETSPEVNESLKDIHDLHEEDSWQKAITNAKSASGDINAMIETSGPIHEVGDKPLDPNTFAKGEDVDLSELNDTN